VHGIDYRSAAAKLLERPRPASVINLLGGGWVSPSISRCFRLRLAATLAAPGEPFGVSQYRRRVLAPQPR
jgi:hypothetical protein